MDRKLHEHLDHLQGLEVEQERHRLRRHFEALHGHSAPNEWLDGALRPRLEAHEINQPLSSPAPGNASESPATPAGWPSFVVPPADLLFRGRILAASALTGAGLAVMGMVFPAMSVGFLSSLNAGLHQTIPVSVQALDTYKAQKASLDQIFEINSAGVSALPDRLAHDNPVCQLFRKHMDEVDGEPTTDIGQILNGAQASIGYDRGCLSDPELFERENAYSHRAQAWSFPTIWPTSSRVHDLVSDKAGLSSQKWCVLTHEWPAGTSSKTRANACARLSGTQHLDHPVSLQSLGVKGLSVSRPVSRASG